MRTFLLATTAILVVILFGVVGSMVGDWLLALRRGTSSLQWSVRRAWVPVALARCAMPWAGSPSKRTLAVCFHGKVGGWLRSSRYSARCDKCSEELVRLAGATVGVLRRSPRVR